MLYYITMLLYSFFKSAKHQPSTKETRLKELATEVESLGMQMRELTRMINSERGQIWSVELMVIDTLMPSIPPRMIWWCNTFVPDGGLYENRRQLHSLRELDDPDKGFFMDCQNVAVIRHYFGTVFRLNALACQASRDYISLRVNP